MSGDSLIIGRRLKGINWRRASVVSQFEIGTGPHPHPATHVIILPWVAGWGCGPVPDFLFKLRHYPGVRRLSPKGRGLI
jgi:hypothetical protein